MNESDWNETCLSLPKKTKNDLLIVKKRIDRKIILLTILQDRRSHHIYSRLISLSKLMYHVVNKSNKN